VIKKIILILIIFVSTQITAQVEEDSTSANIPFVVIENVPVYPGCEGDNNAVLKKCMSIKISEFVSSNFNMKLASSLNLKPGRHRISVQFTINRKGNVVEVHARADHPDLEEEAIRIVSMMPQMTPGMQKGEEVGVLYALPIIFEVEESAKEKRKRLRAEKRKSKG